MKITTESGTVYIIERGFWTRNDEPRRRFITFLSIPKDAQHVEDIIEAQLPAPQIGYCLYLSNFDMWQTSTPVVRVEE